MSDEAAAEFFVAARRGEAAPLRTCVARLVPALEPAIRRSLRRQQALVRRCRVDEEDVVQRAFERLLASPPDNPHQHPPLAVLTAWVRAVAVNHLLDLNRRVGAESLGFDAAPDSETPPPPGRLAARVALPPAQEAQVGARELWRRACDCADRDLARYKHLRELFYAIADEPELGARELAARLGLLAGADGADEGAARRAEQYVWKLRERVHVKLAACLDAPAAEARSAGRGAR
jgi:DNA-directed RNA polymerase specialized sigma24 family protein